MTLKTAHKIALAGIASTAVRIARGIVGAGPQTRVRRRGIDWELDLREGIDFSIYLLGAFEPRTVRAYERIVRPGDTVLDIGANIGAHTLPLAKRVGAAGRVIAFEPTAYAFAKLCRNVELNRPLAARIDSRQCMLIDDGGNTTPGVLFSSWPLARADQQHAKHRGRAMTTEGALAVTLDDFIRHTGLERVDFIKIDVDGHELPVLRGGARTIERFRPKLLIELSPYVHDEEGQSFDELVTFLARFGYRFRDAAADRELPVEPAVLRAMIPDGSSINAVATASHAMRNEAS